ncbi:MAG TPA: hypothetical protein VNV39_17165 [Stellaceae bacterium]|nr:hypothetical protein [Stellaceae bacterium]
MADIVIAVAAEILRREFPVARHAPFLDAAQDLRTTVAAVPAVEGLVEIVGKIAEIFGEGGGRRVPGGPDRALVVAKLRDLDETPLRPVEGRVVGLAEIGHADQPAVGAVAPAVIGAGENGGVALVVAAHLHPAMPARIQKDVDFAGAVAAQDDGFLAHPRDEEVAGVRDLAVVADKEPSAGEQPLLLLLVDRLVDKNLAADPPFAQIDQTRPIPFRARGHHRALPLSSLHVIAAAAHMPARP